MAVWYVGSVQHAAIAQFAISHAYSIGDIVRQLAAPAVGSERAFRCTTAGTSGGSESAWNLTKGATTTQGTAVFTEVTGNSTYGWAAAAARLGHIVGSSWGLGQPDVVAVASSHAETQSSALSVAVGAAVTAPIQIISVNPAGSTPPVSADIQNGASISTTGGSNITLSGGACWQGIAFNAGSGASTASILASGTSGPATRFRFKNCALNLSNSASGSQIVLGCQASLASDIGLENTSFGFGHAGQQVVARVGNIEWKNTASAITGTSPTNLFVDAVGATVKIKGVDFSAVSGTLVVGLSTPTVFDFVNCRFHASATLAAAQATIGALIRMVNCDSAATGYKQARQNRFGKLTQEATIVRSGGASDGVQAISHKIVATANAANIEVFEGFPIAVPNSVTGTPITATVEFVNDGATLKNDEVWIEVEYLGDASYPQSSKTSSGVADPLAAGANLTSSSVAWTTTGLASPVKQKASVTFTPQQAGDFLLTVCCGKASQTLYYCPKVDVT